MIRNPLSSRAWSWPHGVTANLITWGSKEFFCIGPRLYHVIKKRSKTGAKNPDDVLQPNEPSQPGKGPTPTMFYDDYGNISAHGLIVMQENNDLRQHSDAKWWFFQGTLMAFRPASEWLVGSNCFYCHRVLPYFQRQKLPAAQQRSPRLNVGNSIILWLPMTQNK